MRFILLIVGMTIGGAINPEWVQIDGWSWGLFFIMFYAVALDLVKQW